MSWERYTDLGRPSLKQELAAKSVTVSHMCGNLAMMRKLRNRIPSSVLVCSDITLRTADGKPLTVLDSHRGGIKSNTFTQMLHFVTKLPKLFISKTCIKDLNILGKSFSLPEHNGKTLQTLGVAPHSSSPSSLMLSPMLSTPLQRVKFTARIGEEEASQGHRAGDIGEEAI
jgi:hypothetical protein